MMGDEYFAEGIRETWKRQLRKERTAETWRAEAYFTVEAAMIVPVVLCIFVMVIYLSFYLYDRCVLSQDCYLLSYRQSIEKGTADRAGSAAARDQLGGKLFMLSGLDTNVSKGGNIRVCADASMEPPLFGIDLSGIGRKWGLSMAESARRTDPPSDFRKVRRILNLSAKLGGDP